MGEASAKDFLHAGIVVDPGNVLDVESAVARLERSAVLICYHTRNARLFAHIGYIVAFDQFGYLLQPEKFLEILERGYLTACPSYPEREILVRIALGKR